MYALGFGHSDTGRKREKNEDALLVSNETGLYMVCDGMGGHAGGDVASRTAVQVLEREMAVHRGVVERIMGGDLPHVQAVDLVIKSVHRACREIHEASRKHSEYSGMGTTLTLLQILNDKALMAHVGDTRLYLMRGNSIHQLSQDHTMAMELVRKGAIDREQAAGSPYANVLSRAVGIQSSVEVDTLLFDIVPGDVFLLCTDGLTKYASGTEEIAPLMEGELESTPAKLVEYANGQGGRDNVTVVAVKVVAYERERETVVEMDTEVNIKIGALSSSFLFRGLTMAQLAKVMEVCEIRDLQTAQTVVAEGEVNTCMYVVIDGRLELSRAGSVVGQLQAGDLVGETTLLHERPARSTLRATEPTRLLSIDGQAIKSLVQRRPYLGILLLEKLGKRLGRTLDRAHDILADQTLDVSVTHLEPADLF